MQVATIVTLNLALSLTILVLFILILSILLVVTRKSLRQAQWEIKQLEKNASLAQNDEIPTTKLKLATSAKASESNSFVPISLTRSSFMTRSFASRTALDQKIFSSHRGLKDII